MAFQKSKDAQIPLTFPFPGGSPADPPVLSQIEKGILPPAAGLDEAQSLALSRAIVLTAADAAGTADDSSKAAQMFKAGDLKVPRATFMMAMASSAGQRRRPFWTEAAR